MSADPIPREVHEALKRAAEAGADLLLLLAEAAVAYVEGEQPGPWVERIAWQWRDAERTGATRRDLAEEAGNTESFALLAAIEDSFVLSTATDPELAELALPRDEVVSRMEVVREQRERSEPERIAVGDFARFEELSNAVLETHVDNFDLYARLKPDGRELGPDEAAAVRARIDQTAAAGRALDADRELVFVLRTRRDLRTDLDVLRSTQHGFVLALAGDAGLRTRAIPATELGGLWKPLYERWRSEPEAG